MKINEWLNTATEALKHAGIESARLDALVLLSDELKKDKSWLLAYSDHKLQRSELNSLNTKVAQRAKHTPLAYIRGQVEFYGNNFAVDASVLVPRPETESFLEIVRMLDPTSFLAIIDVGTGSGALAISAGNLLPNHAVCATDISQEAIAVAQHNAKNLNATVKFFHGNLIEPISDADLDTSILLCNLPYVPEDYKVNNAAKHEPAIALYSGTDGLGHYTQLFTQIKARNEHKPRYVLTESLLPQHKAIQSLAREAGYRQLSIDGLVQNFERI